MTGGERGITKQTQKQRNKQKQNCESCDRKKSKIDKNRIKIKSNQNQKQTKNNNNKTHTRKDPFHVQSLSSIPALPKGTTTIKQTHAESIVSHHQQCWNLRTAHSIRCKPKVYRKRGKRPPQARFLQRMASGNRRSESMRTRVTAVPTSGVVLTFPDSARKQARFKSKLSCLRLRTALGTRNKSECLETSDNNRQERE